MSAPKRHILIIRFSSIGDILLTTPFLRQVRRHFPDAHICYVTKQQFRELLETNPAIDELITFDDKSGLAGIRKLSKQLSSAHFDYVFDLHDNQRSHLLTRGLKYSALSRLQKHRFQRAAYVYLKQRITLRPVALRYMDAGKQAAIADDGEGLELHIPGATTQKISGLLQQAVNSPFLCLAPGAGFATKRWPYWDELARKILDNSSFNLVIVGGQDDRKRVQMENPRLLNLAGQLSLSESGAVIQAAQGLVCNDSGLMHMAAAVGTPVTAIFGSTTPELGFAPFRAYKAVIIEKKNIWCRPCSHMGRNRCPLGHHKCMTSISPDMVFKQTMTLLE